MRLVADAEIMKKDFSFLVGDVDIRKFGSQGQQRTAALSLKLSEIEGSVPRLPLRNRNGRLRLFICLQILKRKNGDGTSCSLRI